jgi:hypothetical protein
MRPYVHVGARKRRVTGTTSNTVRTKAARSVRVGEPHLPPYPDEPRRCGLPALADDAALGDRVSEPGNSALPATAATYQ